MDTIMNLTFYGENGEQAMTAAVSEIQQLEKTLSVTKADSEISKINAAGGKKVTVSKETYDLLSACIQYGNDTGGLFDISIYPLVKLWGFTTEKYHVPENNTGSNFFLFAKINNFLGQIAFCRRSQINCHAGLNPHLTIRKKFYLFIINLFYNSIFFGFVRHMIFLCRPRKLLIFAKRKKLLPVFFP